MWRKSAGIVFCASLHSAPHIKKNDQRRKDSRSFISITVVISQRQFAPKCSFLARRPLGRCSLRIFWQIP